MTDVARKIELAYELAGERCAAIGVDTGGVLQRFDETPISIHRWQGNDVRGFENPDGTLTGGILACGNYPDHTSNGDELRADISSKAAKHSDRVNAGRGRDIQQTL